MNEDVQVIYIGGQAYHLGHDRYIRRNDDVKILGRASCNGDGAAGWYQLAGRPHDEPSVAGFTTLSAAFGAAVNELERRRKRV
jgi:hypothetical protein